MRILFMGTPDFAEVSLEAVYNSGYEIIGVVKSNGKEIKTNSFKIHYSKTGTHIVPYRKGGK